MSGKKQTTREVRVKETITFNSPKVVVTKEASAKVVVTKAAPAKAIAPKMTAPKAVRKK